MTESHLICNFRKCRKKLTTHAVITSCSHIFCTEDIEREFQKNHVCPECGTQLEGKYDIIKQSLNPTEEYKSMILSGLRPETVIDICSRSVSFWAYQVQNEIMYQEFLSTKSKEKMTRQEHYYNQICEKAQAENNAIREKQKLIKKELEVQKKTVLELNEQLMEKTKQYQKLHAKYETVKRKPICPFPFEDDAPKPRKTNAPEYNFAFPMADEMIQSYVPGYAHSAFEYRGFSKDVPHSFNNNYARSVTGSAKAARKENMPVSAQRKLTQN